jgi:cell division septum initiation protein DivIVA
MEITPRELRDSEIAEAFRGYNRDVVNDMLERAAAALESANDRVRQLTEQLAAAQAEAGRTRETEDILHRTLLLAQRAADEAVAEAQSKAQRIVSDAESSARRMLADAEAEALRHGESERERLAQEVVDLAARRDALESDVEALGRFETEYRDRMVRALEADLAALRTRPPAAPGPVPETSDVAVPALPEAIVRPAAGEATAALDMQPLVDATTDDEETGADLVADADTDDASAPAAAIDLSEEEADAEVLDDDAFFATLRDAVHDDAPLGPRDEERSLSFFDQEDDERASLRDVFRRRR